MHDTPMPVEAASPARGKRHVSLGLVAMLLATACLPLRAAVPQLSGWTLRFSDDFNGAAGHLPASQRWIFDTGHGYPGANANWGTLEVEAYTRDPRNISLDGRGHLRITPRRDKAGHWTSGRIKSRRQDFSAPPGGVLRIQARIRLPDVHGKAALGYWPAFWVLGHGLRKQRDWPAAGEIDVMENVNGLDRIWGTLHCGAYPGGPCHEKQGLSADTACPGAPCQAAFHTYTAEWDGSTTSQQIRWYVDGQLYHTVRQDQLPAWVWQRMTAGKGMYVLLNVAMGGDFPDDLGRMRTPVASTQPGHPMVVDYVAVWTRAVRSGSAHPARETVSGAQQ